MGVSEKRYNFDISKFCSYQVGIDFWEEEKVARGKICGIGQLSELGNFVFGEKLSARTLLLHAHARQISMSICAKRLHATYFTSVSIATVPILFIRSHKQVKIR